MRICFPKGKLRGSTLPAPPVRSMVKLNELFVYAGDHGIPAVCAHRRVRQLCQHSDWPITASRGLSGVHRTAAASIAISSPRSRTVTGYKARAAWSACSSPACRRLRWTTSPVASTSAATSAWNRKFDQTCLVLPRPRCGNLLELYRDHGAFDQEVEAALDVMREWYNGYRFSERGRS